MLGYIGIKTCRYTLAKLLLSIEPTLDPVCEHPHIMYITQKSIQSTSIESIFGAVLNANSAEFGCALINENLNQMGTVSENLWIQLEHFVCGRLHTFNNY